MFNQLQSPDLSALSALKKLRPSSPYESLVMKPDSALLEPEDYTQQSFSPGGGQVARPPEAVNLDYLGRMRNETEDRAFAAQRTGDVNEYGALRGLLARNQRDIEENPITQQGAQTRAIEKANLRAQMQGFRTPEEAAQYGREFETTKMNIPLRQQEVQNLGEVEKQREASRGQLAVEQERTNAGSGLNSYYGALANTLAVPDSNNPIKSANRSGVTFNQEKGIPPALETQLANARRMGTQDQIDQLEGTMLNYFDPEVRDVVTAIKNDPQGVNDAWVKIQRDLMANSPEITPQQLGQIRRALSIVRGRDF
jgi:hypothetical protein